MQKLIIDSSVIVKWLSQQGEERLPQADMIMSDAQENSVLLLAPELAKYEIGNALLIHKEILVNEAEILFSNLFALPIQFISQSEDLAKETYKIAKDTNITFYDASFMALAKQENAVLVTDNPKHQGKTTEIKVKSLQDY